MTTLYYDPTLDIHHRLPVSSALTTSFYAAPQVPADARRLFDAACTSIGVADSPQLPLRASRAFSSALLLAREWGLPDLEERLVTAIEASYEPTWDKNQGEFTWGMGLNEPHPRGQFNAFLAAAEATGPGLWSRLSAAPIETCPQVVGVDVPNMMLSRAEWVDGNLHLRLNPLRPDPNRSTSFHLVGAEPRQWDLVGLNGATLDLRSGGLDIRVPMVNADISLVRSSY